eukprot:TRINITY_DN67806_c0_g1_i1.p1 TRINITY_DN67806_c0_g1~~TRINITY_DN67806_c0_g1_i1.p1  ORF type:complete len:226 (+),score=42.38 TRINITY_DN67806_c0_g1_i1:60-737(+)
MATLQAMATALRPPAIVALSGSCRAGSMNTTLLAAAAKKLESMGAEVKVVDLNEYNLPLFNQDLETPFPEMAKQLKQQLTASDGLLFATPEYNGFPPPLIINAITWATRGEGGMYDAFKGKPAVTISASPGPMGGMRAKTPMVQFLQNCGALVLPETVAVGSAFKAFKEDGSIHDEKQDKFLHGAMGQLFHQARSAANRDVTCKIMQEVASMPAPGEYGTISVPE